MAVSKHATMPRAAKPSAKAAGAREGKRPGYRQILVELIEEIQNGVWPIGVKLPTELDLVDRYGVSRNTVREALRELQDLGYLSKRRGTRSVVLRTSTDQDFVNSIRSIDELLEYASAAHNTLLAADRIILMEDQARQLGFAPAGSEWLRLQVLRRKLPDAPPFCYSEIYLDPRYSAVLEDMDNHKSVYSALQKRYNMLITRVVQDIEASAATPALALRLDLPAGSPILLARTSFYGGDGKLIEVGLAHFAAGRYRLRIGLERRKPVD